MLQNTYYFTRAPAGPARQAARCLLLTWRVVFCLVAAVAVWPDMQQQQQPLCYFVLLLLLLLLLQAMAASLFCFLCSLFCTPWLRTNTYSPWDFPKEIKRGRALASL